MGMEKGMHLSPHSRGSGNPIETPSNNSSLGYLDDLLGYEKEIIAAEEQRIQTAEKQISDLKSATRVNAQEVFTIEDNIRIIKNRINYHQSEITRLTKLKEKPSQNPN